MPRRSLLPCILFLGLATCAPAQPPGDGAAASGGCDPRFRVVNASGLPVERLFFSPANLNAWGADQLGDRMLPPGRTLGFAAANPGAYDFRVVWTNGQAAELRAVNLCTASNIVITNGSLNAS
jgi:hypothetical protein